MTQMSSSGRFVPKEYEVDYEQEPCYAHYGLKHGTLTRYSDDLENESYRTAIQVRIKTIDFVRKYADELKIRMSGLEFLSLVNQWAKIQEHSKKNQDKFIPYYMSEDGKFSIEYKTFGTQSHNIMYITSRRKMSLALSVAEIMCNSQAELRAIYDEWVRVSTADPATLKPIPIEMGKGNSKVIESTACAVYNPSKFLQANNNNRSTTYLPVDVMKQSAGIEQSQEALFDSDDDIMYIAENVMPTNKPKAQPVRAKRRRTVVDPDPLNEEPGVFEESQDDQVARYFNSPQGKMDLAKYGKVQARKKAKTMAAIMH